jgi:hypothetical protein
MKTEEAITFCKHKAGMAKIPIWDARWHDRRVLIAPLKVKDHNVIAFTKSKSLEGLFYISGKNIRKYPKQSNGTIMCFIVPLDDLLPFEFERHCIHEY